MGRKAMTISMGGISAQGQPSLRDVLERGMTVLRGMGRAALGGCRLCLRSCLRGFLRVASLLALPPDAHLLIELDELHELLQLWRIAISCGILQAGGRLLDVWQRLSEQDGAGALQILRHGRRRWGGLLCHGLEPVAAVGAKDAGRADGMTAISTKSSHMICSFRLA